MRTLTLSSLVLFRMITMAQGPGDDMLAGMSALRKEDHPTAELAFSRAVTSEPSNAKTWYYRGVNRLTAGDAQGAWSDLDQALKLAPDDVNSLLRRAEASTQLGAEHMATTDLQRVIELRPTGPATEHALLQLGNFAMAKTDLVAAKGFYDRLVIIAPLNAFGWCDRGIVLAAMHMDDDALVDLDKAITIDPTLDQAHVNKAIVLFRMERRQEACDALHQAHDMGDRSVEELMLIYCD
ncbi:MAG: tetratricopeptide repeat protein [Flavobacteriales bacterium]